MNDRMLLFIPAYNCEKQIVRVLHQLDEEVVPYFEEILVVNNRSTDHTEQVVMEYLAEHPSLPVKLMRNDDNYGRTLGNVVYDFIFAFITKQRIFDLGSGLNLYSTKMLEDSFFEKFPDNLMFNYVMILASHYYKHDIIFYPVSWREDDQVSNVKMVNQAVTVLKMAFGYLFDHEKIKQEYREVVRESYTSRQIEELADCEPQA